MVVNYVFLLLAGVSLLIYCWTYCSVNGVPKSISETFYELNDNAKWVFYLLLSISSMTLIICGWNLLLPDLSVIPYMPIGGAILMFVPAVANFKYKKVGWLHYVGAGGGYGLAGLSFGLSYDLWVLTIAMATTAVVLAMANIKHKIFWIEVALAAELLLGILLLTILK